MTAFLLHADPEGHACGGSCVDSALSSETWRLTGFPVRSPEDCGFTIAWPNGIPFEHQHYVGSVEQHNEQERAA